MVSDPNGLLLCRFSVGIYELAVSVKNYRKNSILLDKTVILEHAKKTLSIKDTIYFDNRGAIIMLPRVNKKRKLILGQYIELTRLKR